VAGGPCLAASFFCLLGSYFPLLLFSVVVVGRVSSKGDKTRKKINTTKLGRELPLSLLPLIEQTPSLIVVVVVVVVTNPVSFVRCGEEGSPNSSAFIVGVEIRHRRRWEACKKKERICRGGNRGFACWIGSVVCFFLFSASLTVGWSIGAGDASPFPVFLLACSLHAR
jgi:hypothetical protein